MKHPGKIRNKSTRVNSSGLLLALPVVLLFVVAQVYVGYKQREATEKLFQTQTVMAAITDLLSVMKDMETGQRGYVLTADPKYLAPFDKALRDVDGVITYLSALTADNIRQRALIDDARHLVDAKTAELQETIDLTANGDRAGALKIVDSDLGRSLMVQLRKVLKRMADEETYLLSTREATLKRTQIAGTTVEIVSLVLILAISFSAIRNFRRLLAHSRGESQSLIEAQKERAAALEKLRIHSDNQELLIEERTRQLAVKVQEAEKANNAKTEFLSSMSHELRTPLNAIIGFGQYMDHDEKLSPEHRDSVHEITAAGHHLLDLINEVLDLSKVETGTVSLSLESLEIESILRECIELVQPMIERRSLTFKFQNIQPGVIFADRIRLKQAVLNLLSNAIKYDVEYGEIELSGAISSDGKYRISISDTGPGIAEENKAALFKPFERLGAEFTDIEGTGIGLTLTQKLITLMDGELSYANNRYRGATFHILLPLGEPVFATLDDVNENDGEVTMSTLPEQLKTVLYIEDNPANLKLMRKVLAKRSKLRLLTAHTPQLGIELANTHKPDLLLLDINLPGMDGYQVLNIIQQTNELKTIPVIAVTANAMHRDIERGMDAGFAAYLAKPFDFAHLHDLLDAYLKGPNNIVVPAPSS
ncbi:CHASE3 domain-containing protein [Halioglobus japonicus]|uniref:histidine kinase n=1 Tax=Halioglobus japonicus TaxID=930805 RepID=A0AAP8SN57_9GAMM|nr:CHASE3 domain-containing protein [Halioglobus japonicus]PLW86131.1 hypothetical protein C0029_06690 [Halioglobus japonicus]